MQPNETRQSSGFGSRCRRGRDAFANIPRPSTVTVGQVNITVNVLWPNAIAKRSSRTSSPGYRPV
jgi:hypothetical protein